MVVMVGYVHLTRGREHLVQEEIQRNGGEVTREVREVIEENIVGVEGPEACGEVHGEAKEYYPRQPDATSDLATPQVVEGMDLAEGSFLAFKVQAVFLLGGVGWSISVFCVHFCVVLQRVVLLLVHGSISFPRELIMHGRVASYRLFAFTSRGGSRMVMVSGRISEAHESGDGGCEAHSLNT